MKKIIPLFSILFLISGIGNSTNVSGGIYVNTTWTLANSPYIVTDTVVVFPNLTLTIQPGVIVRFANNKYLELRQSSLIAIGTPANRIVFTSNTSTSAGSWQNILRSGGGNHTCRLSYCDFSYANSGFYGNDSLFVKHCTFTNNNIGINGVINLFVDSSSFTNNAMYGIESPDHAIINYSNFSNNGTGIDNPNFTTLNNCVIDSNQTGIYQFHYSHLNNCVLDHNQNGILVVFGANGANIKNCSIDSNAIIGITIGASEDSLLNCQIKYNGIGVNATQGYVIAKNSIEHNSIGIKIGNASQNNSIYCNKICNNTTYDLQSIISNNISLPNNYFCTSDSASTEAVIYDGHDNINIGLINFMPMDSLCYLATGLNEPGIVSSEFGVFPNPASTNFTISNSLHQTDFPAAFTILNMQGQIVLRKEINSSSEQIDVSEFSEGVYFCSLQSKNGAISHRKIVISR
jgi:hypothetical protein